jgi:hypothetical protein
MRVLSGSEMQPDLSAASFSVGTNIYYESGSFHGNAPLIRYILKKKRHCDEYTHKIHVHSLTYNTL